MSHYKSFTCEEPNIKPTDISIITKLTEGGKYYKPIQSPMIQNSPNRYISDHNNGNKNTFTITYKLQ